MNKNLPCMLRRASNLRCFRYEDCIVFFVSSSYETAPGYKPQAVNGIESYVAKST